MSYPQPPNLWINAGFMLIFICGAIFSFKYWSKVKNDLSRNAAIVTFLPNALFIAASLFGLAMFVGSYFSK